MDVLEAETRHRRFDVLMIGVYLNPKEWEDTLLRLEANCSKGV